MKKTFIIYFLLNISFVFAQLTHVPDDNFEQRLINLGYDDVLDDYVLTANISDVISLNVQLCSISDLTGIEGFTDLEWFGCTNNNLTNIDFSQNTNLTSIYCNNNQLTNLDISQNTALVVLMCFNNQLTDLDISQNIELGILNCTNNQLIQVDFSNNTSLHYLTCDNNQLVELDVSQNLALYDLYCDDNQLTQLDISQNIALINLSCADNQLTNLDISHNTSLSKLLCDDNQLTYLDARNGYNIHFPPWNFTTLNNPNLTCIYVDDAAWSAANWIFIDPTSAFVETQAECDALGIDEIEFNNSIEVFPNPTNNLLNIRLLNEIEMNDAVLYNNLGKTIIKTNNSFMDVSNLETGIYILRIITKDDRIISKIIIIENE